MSVNCNRQGKGVESASKIRFLTANVRGWGDIIKAGKQMVHYKTFDPSIICVSETKFDKRKEKQFRNSYSSEYRCFFNSYASNARGVAVLISKKQPVKILGRAEDDQGRYLVIFVEINGKTLAIASVYAPNEDCPDFFEDLFEVVYNLIQNMHLLRVILTLAPLNCLTTAIIIQ
jgi:exonuclease III